MSSMSANTRKAVENGAVDKELFNLVKSSLIIPHFAIIIMMFIRFYIKLAKYCTMI